MKTRNWRYAEREVFLKMDYANGAKGWGGAKTEIKFLLMKKL